MSDLLKNLEFTVHSTSFEKSTTKDGRRLIQGYASTDDLDRQQEIISREALEGARDDLLKNTTVFMEHQHSMLPVGKVIACFLDDVGLLITVELSKAKFVDDIWTLCEEGILNSFSIGGIVIDGHDERREDGKSYHIIDKISLLEVSIVGLPANPSAKFEPIYKSFKSAIAEQIKQKEDSQKMTKQDKQEILKSEALQEPIKVEEPKEQTASTVSEETKEVTKEVVEETKKDETTLVAKEVEKSIEENKEEVVDVSKTEEAPKDVEKVKVDETPSDDNPKQDLKAKYSDVEKAEWTTEYINTLPNSSFAVIEPAYLDGKTEDKNCRHLPFKDENGVVDLPHYRNALARCNQIEPITDSISTEDLRSQAATELEKYRNLLGKEDTKSIDEKILDALSIIIEKLSTLDKKEDVVEQKKEEKSQEVIEEHKNEEVITEKKEDTTVEKVVEKNTEEPPTRKSIAIVVPSPYAEEKKEVDPKETERSKNLGWNKLIFGK